MTEAEAINFAFSKILASTPAKPSTDTASQLFRLQDAVDAMLREYDKALSDPQFKAPTTLHLMIAALRP